MDTQGKGCVFVYTGKQLTFVLIKPTQDFIASHCGHSSTVPN